MKVITNSIFLVFLLTFLTTNFIFCQEDPLKDLDLGYYLPKMEFDASILSPKEYLGYEVGEMYVNHDQQLAYMKMLAASSDRVSLTTYGYTYEKRPLVYLTITSPENHDNIESIKSEHAKLSDVDFRENLDFETMPLVLYQGYSIHGDEASGGNAALAVAYYLAAGKSKRVKQTLKDMVILLDPCYNPDGFQRYASWVNSTRENTLNPDPNDINHNEPWPTGRTNHYWFDLNRDWLLLTHPESRGRIKTFQEWHPNVLTDHHEMGTNSTFFFQPGVPTRTFPMTPQVNQDLTQDIADYHISYLDSLGAKYFSRERFDDFYYGKGSTYPDGQGCVGILFEQATSEGIIQESKNGLLTFPFGIRNQVVTSLSTHKGCLDLKEEILKYQYDFFRERFDQAKKEKIKAYVVREDDPWKRNRFANILEQHDIKVYESGSDMKFVDDFYPQNSSLIVPLEQRQNTLIRSIFEQLTSFQDSIFYDVSTWVFPFAFNSNYTSVSVGDEYSTGRLYNSNTKGKRLINGTDLVALPWSNYMTPSVSYKLLANEVPVYRLSKMVSGEYGDLPSGTAIVDLSSQKEELINEFQLLINQNNIESIPIVSPIDELKNNGLETLKKPVIGLITGNGVNSYEAGDAMFQLDYRWQIPVTRIDLNFLSKTNLDRYTTLIFADGNYNLDTEHVEKLAAWVSEGGTLLCIRRAIQAFQNENWFVLSNKSDNDSKEIKESSGQVIGGAIYETKIDLDDPLFYGYSKDILPVFKKGTQWYDVPENEQIVTPGKYTENPRLSGYSSKQNIAKASNSASAMYMNKGEGKVIMLVDNPNFRGYWYGGGILFANCIFD